MKRLAIASLLFLGLYTLPAWGDDPFSRLASPPKAVAAPKAVSPGEVTPEMWFYQQYQQQFQNPQEMVHQRADYTANQRLRRLTAMRWFGYSNQRPQAAIDPIHGNEYSAGWASNNSAYPYRWQGSGQHLIVLSGSGESITSARQPGRSGG